MRKEPGYLERHRHPLFRHRVDEGDQVPCSLRCHKPAPVQGRAEHRALRVEVGPDLLSHEIGAGNEGEPRPELELVPALMELRVMDPDEGWNTEAAPNLGHPVRSLQLGEEHMRPVAAYPGLGFRHDQVAPGSSGRIAVDAIRGRSELPARQRPERSIPEEEPGRELTHIGHHLALVALLLQEGQEVVDGHEGAINAHRNMGFLRGKEDPHSPTPGPWL